jgi:hypothetical protein
MKRKKRQPDAAAGGFLIALGGIVLILTIFFATDLGQKSRGMAAGLLALSWGCKEVAAAKKWKQEPEEEHYATTAQEIRESKQEERLEKSGSMHNVLKLLGWVLLFVVGAAIAGLCYVWFFPYNKYK